MDIIISILGVILTIFLIVGIHEFGHFIVARMCGIKVLRFSIGFGKSLYSWSDKKGTEYVLAAIPLGGYVKMVDETEENVTAEDLPFAYNRQPMYKRIAVVVAGPLFNFIFAFLIYWAIFMTGFTTVAPITGKILPGSIAAMAGLKPQDEIISIDHRPTNSWASVMIRLSQFIGSVDNLVIETQHQNAKVSSAHTLNLSQWKIDALKPDPLKSLGIEPYEPNIPAIIGSIQPGSAAEKSTLKVGDSIISIANKPVKNWMDAIEIITAHPLKTLT
jgi:regulator of sigma E protease